MLLIAQLEPEDVNLSLVQEKVQVSNEEGVLVVGADEMSQLKSR